MEAIGYQVHQKFKVFLAPSIGQIADAVRLFTANGDIAAKSIGIEFLESRDSYFVSLGYTTGQPGYAVTLNEHSVGNISDAASLEAALESIANSSGDVICHEMYIDGTGNATVVFMVTSRA